MLRVVYTVRAFVASRVRFPDTSYIACQCAVVAGLLQHEFASSDNRTDQFYLDGELVFADMI
jgi:hypothetical protein